MQINQLHDLEPSPEEFSLEILRLKWAEAWSDDPHGRIGRTMLIRSLKFKNQEKISGGLDLQYQQRLDQLIKAYKRNSNFF